jgi:DNA (cytosine-5)-methyltransferase 1
VRTTYNEIDPFAAGWLERLSSESLIPPGPVLRESICDLAPSDVGESAHFFAGIGGWPLALDLAGWPRDLPVWTGSCPCQPFSVAGMKKGFDDDRHLWPEFLRLIRSRTPTFVFGEQVAGRAGRDWLDTVSNDLRRSGYAFRSAELPAGSFGAPHRRSRIFFVGVADGGPRALGDTDRARRDKRRLPREQSSGGGSPIPGSGSGPLAAYAEGIARRAWGGAQWIPCADGRDRLVEPGTRPVANGIPARVGRLRGYGNAIVPQVAAIFVRSVMECFAD